MQQKTDEKSTSDSQSLRGKKQNEIRSQRDRQCLFGRRFRLHHQIHHLSGRRGEYSTRLCRGARPCYLLRRRRHAQRDYKRTDERGRKYSDRLSADGVDKRPRSDARNTDKAQRSRRAYRLGAHERIRCRRLQRTSVFICRLLRPRHKDIIQHPRRR